MFDGEIVCYDTLSLHLRLCRFEWVLPLPYLQRFVFSIVKYVESNQKKLDKNYVRSRLLSQLFIEWLRSALLYEEDILLCQAIEDAS